MKGIINSQRGHRDCKNKDLEMLAGFGILILDIDT